MDNTQNNKDTINPIKRYKILYCTPSLHMSGGVERVLTTKANYFADVYGYDIYIVLTDGKDKSLYYKLSSKIHIIQLDINFEELWNRNFLCKSFLYLKKQRIFKKKLAQVLFDIKPDFTISLLRREINFITSFNDGSIKIGEMHVNKNNFRNFEKGDSNLFKKVFSHFWMLDLKGKLQHLDQFIVLTNEDRENWKELKNITVINNPLSSYPKFTSSRSNKRVIAVGRFVYQKGFDMLLDAWKKVIEKHKDWHLYIFGSGDKTAYIDIAKKMNIIDNCHLNDAVKDIDSEYCKSSIFAFSSRFEGFGMVLIEAMSCGLPCISFDSPCGPKDIIENGENGFLIHDFDIKDFATKLGLMIEDKELRDTMGDKALLSSKKYTIDEIGDKWKSLFDELYSMHKI